MTRPLLRKQQREILARDIETLKENPGIKVQIEGHTCAHGTEDYNMALGERRANAVKEYLVNQGIAAERMTSNKLWRDTTRDAGDTDTEKQTVKGSKDKQTCTL